MSCSAICINDILPSEILQQIFRLSVESFSDALILSTTCRYWRKLIFNQLMIGHYWQFNDNYRKKNLVRWWHFTNDDDNGDPSNPFINYKKTDCFLGKCCIFDSKLDVSQDSNDKILETVIDRGQNYSVAFWICFNEIKKLPTLLFSICDTDWDYSRSAGVAIDEENYLSIVFYSNIGQQLIPSNRQFKFNEWFHIVLVQERKNQNKTPEQKLWINGKLELTIDVPIAAYDTSAILNLYSKQDLTTLIADFSVWTRCLLPIEIRSIFQQKTSIGNVDIAKYIFDNQT